MLNDVQGAVVRSVFAALALAGSHAAAMAVTAVGLKPILEDASSTDSNLAISLGVPAVTIGRGGLNENQHSINESFDPKDAYLGVQKNLLTVLTLVGIEGVAEPLLAKRR